MSSALDKKLSRLIELGPEILADALLELAIYNHDAESLIARLTDSNDEKIKRFKSKLANFKRMDFVDWRNESAFARELGYMLAELKEAQMEPRKGVELVALFYKSDADIFDNSDDSGEIGTIFREDAADLFAYFGAGCKDKDWLLELILSLNMDNGYGVRDALFERVSEFLPPDQIKKLVDKLWDLAADTKISSRRYEWLSALKSVSRSTKDPELLEVICRARDSGLLSQDHLDIANMHLQSGNAQAALTWVERAPEDATTSHFEQDKLLKSIHKQLGNKSKVEELAWQAFNSYRSKEALTELLSAIGKDKRQEVVADAVKKILKSSRLSYTDLDFLVDAGLVDEAEKYLIIHASKLDGNHYYTLLPIAEIMKKHKHYFASTIIYRELLTSILERGQSKAYEYGADYLQELKKLAKKIENWHDIERHEEFVENLTEKHKRKTSFWMAVERIQS